jgi:hypothetical protein
MYHYSVLYTTIIYVYVHICVTIYNYKNNTIYLYPGIHTHTHIYIYINKYINRLIDKEINISRGGGCLALRVYPIFMTA